MPAQRHRSSYLLSVIAQVMAVSFERLRARIACCRHALQNASQDMLSVHSLAQRNAIEDMLQRSTLDAEERASIVIELGQCGFFEQE